MAGGFSPLVSVVIPTRNRMVMLGEAVASVRAQTLRDWELVIVEDASEDGTTEWLAELRDSRIRTFRLERHSERSAARNLGLARVRTEFVLFLDDDDRLRPWALGNLVGPLRRRPDAIAAVGARVLFDGTGWRQRNPHPWIGFTRSVWPDVLFGWIPAPGQWMFRTNVIQTSGGFSESFVPLEDYELWLKVVRLGPTIVIPWNVLEYRIHSGHVIAPHSDAALDTIRQNAINRMRGADREGALRILQARARLVTAHHFYSAGKFGKALRLYLATCALAPGALQSMISGPAIFSQTIKSAFGLFLGPGAARIVRRFKAVLRDNRYRQSKAVHDINGGSPS